MLIIAWKLLEEPYKINAETKESEVGSSENKIGAVAYPGKKAGSKCFISWAYYSIARPGKEGQDER